MGKTVTTQIDSNRKDSPKAPITPFLITSVIVLLLISVFTVIPEKAYALTGDYLNDHPNSLTALTDGTPYYIQSLKNPGYGVDIAGTSPYSGDWNNLQLWASGGDTFKFYKNLGAATYNVDDGQELAIKGANDAIYMNMADGSAENIARNYEAGMCPWNDSWWDGSVYDTSNFFVKMYDQGLSDSTIYNEVYNRGYACRFYVRHNNPINGAYIGSYSYWNDLDVNGGTMANGTDISFYPYNGTAAQYFVPCKASGSIGVNGGNVYWFIMPDNALVISGSGQCNTNGTDVPWASYADQITAVYMDSDVTPLNTKYWFKNCIKLTTTNASEWNLGLDCNMSYMFSNCTKLTSIALNTSTGLSSDMTDMFVNCSSLTSADFSKFNTANSTSFGYMFYNCRSLKSLDLSGFNTAKATNFTYMFCGCSSLTSLDLSGFNTANSTSFSSMFSYCSSLTSLDLSGFNTSKATSFSSMFNYCSSLTSLNLSGFNTANSTDFSSMFYYCPSLTSLDLSGFNTAKATRLGYMFYCCSSLTSLDLSGFNTAKVTSFNNMFSYCSSLTSLALPSSFSSVSALNMNSMFKGMTSLRLFSCNSVDFTLYGKITDKNNYAILPTPTVLGGCWTKDGGNTFSTPAAMQAFNGATMHGTWTWAENTGVDWFIKGTAYSGNINGVSPILQNTALQSSYNNDSSIPNGCLVIYPANGNNRTLSNAVPWEASLASTAISSITSVKVQNGVKTVNACGIFSKLPNCESIDISKLDTSQCLDMSSLFLGDYKLKSVKMPITTTSLVEDFSHMFDQDSCIQSLDLSNLDTRMAGDMEDMFTGCCFSFIKVGSNFSFFYSFGDVAAVLPSPPKDSTYSGKWQAVGTGTADAPNGTVYELPSDVPDNTANTYVWQKAQDMMYTATPYTLSWNGFNQTLGDVSVVNPSTAVVKYGTSSGNYTLSTCPAQTNVGTYTTYYQITAPGYKTVTGSFITSIAKITNTPGVTLSPSTPVALDNLTCGLTNTITNPTTTFTYRWVYASTADAASWTAINSTTTTAVSNTIQIPAICVGKYIRCVVTGDNTTYVITTLQPTSGQVLPNTIIASSTSWTGNYDGFPHSGAVSVQKPAKGSAQGTASVVYRTSSDSNWSSTIPTFTNAGIYTTYYEITAPGFSAKDGQFTTTVKPATPSVLSTGWTGAYDGAKHTGSVSVMAPSSGATVLYSTDNATWSSTEPSYISAGSYTVYYKVSAANYVDTTGNFTVAINKITPTITLSESSGASKFPDGASFTYSYNGDGKVSASSSNPSVASAVARTRTDWTYDELSALSQAGTQKHTDAQFAQGTNGAHVYNNANNGVVTMERVASPAGCPTSSGYCLKLTTASNTASPGLGGFYFSDATNFNSMYVYVIQANIPVGYSINYASNGVGSGETAIHFVGDTTGSGTWKTYIAYAKAGSNYSGTYSWNGLSTTGYFYLSGSSATPVTWYVSSATMYDCTGASDYVNRPVSLTSKAAGASTITVSAPATTNYNAASTTYTYTVENGTIVANDNDWSGTYDGAAHSGSTTVSSPVGTTTQYSTAADSASWTSTLPTYTNAGTYTTYRKVSAPNYDPSYGSFTTTIAKKPSTITLSSNSGEIVYPNTGSFTYTKTGDGQMSVSSSNTSVATATIDSTNNTITITPGTVTDTPATITVSESEGTNYKASSASYTLTRVSAGKIVYTSSATPFTYDKNAHALGTVSVTSPSNGSAIITYGTSDSTCTSSSCPTQTLPGTYTTYYKITAPGYSPETGSFATVVSKQSWTTMTSAISGTAKVGCQLSAAPGNVPDTGASSYNYQWYRGDSTTGAFTKIPSANSQQYTLSTADFGKYIKCEIGCANGNYIVTTALSGASAQVDKGSFTLAGQILPSAPTVGQSVAATLSTMPAGDSSLKYTWFYGFESTWTPIIGGAHTGVTISSDSIIVPSAARGKLLKCVIEGDNTYYVLISSAPVSSTGAAAGTLSGSVTISGTAQCLDTLTASSLLSEGAIAKYQWYKNGTAISGATASTYTLTYDDFNAIIAVGATDITGAWGGEIKSQDTALVALGFQWKDITNSGNVRKASFGASTSDWSWAINTSGVTSTSFDIPSTFYDNANQIRYTITEIGAFAFYGNNTLTSYTLPSTIDTIDINGLRNIPKLTNISIPNTVKKIGDYAFGECQKVSSVYIPASVTVIGNNIFYNNGLSTIAVDAANPSFQTVNGMLTDKPASKVFSYPSKSPLTSLVIPNGIKNIGSYALCYAGNLTTVSIPSSLTSISDCAFYGVRNITEMDIPSSVASISTNAFTSCTSLSKFVFNGDCTNIKFGTAPFSNGPSTRTVVYRGKKPASKQSFTSSDSGTSSYYALDYYASAADGQAKSNRIGSLEVLAGTNVESKPSETMPTTYDGKWHESLSYENDALRTSGIDNSYYAVILSNIGDKGANVSIPDNEKVASQVTSVLSQTPDGMVPSYQWFVSDNQTGPFTTITGATGASFVPDYHYGGKYLEVSVSDASGTYSGALVSNVENVAKTQISGNLTISDLHPVVGGAYKVSASNVSPGAALSYQWYRTDQASATGGTAISGAAGTSYAATSADFGKRLYVIATDENGYYTGSLSTDVTAATDKGAWSNMSAHLTVAQVNIEGTAAVSVSGLPTSGVTSVSYQWLVNGTVISGATNASYVAKASDAGKSLSCSVSAINDYYNINTVSTTQIPVGRIAIYGTVSVSGKDIAGETLSASVSGMPASARPAYAWYRGNIQILGATSSSYTTVMDDFGQTVTCRVSDANGYYTSYIADVGHKMGQGVLSGAVTASYQSYSGANGSLHIEGSSKSQSDDSPSVLVNGISVATPSTGTTLTVIKRSDLSVVSSTTYDTFDNPANQSSLANALGNLDSSVIVIVTSKGSQGSSSSMSEALQRCGAVADISSFSSIPYAFVGIPGYGVGSGIEVVGNASADSPHAVINCSVSNGVPSEMSKMLSSSISGMQSISVPSYQWYVDLGTGYTSISGATGSSYAPTQSYNGKSFKVRVTDARGINTGYIESNSISTAQNMVQGRVIVNKLNPILGDTLTASWSMSVSSNAKIQWYRETTAISGATSASYKTTFADFGCKMHVVITDGSNTYTSNLTSPVTANIAKATWTGYKASLSNSSLNIFDNISAVSSGEPDYGQTMHTYQWYLAGTAVSNAISSSYTAAAADAGKVLYCIVKTTNPYYTVADSKTESVTIGHPTLTGTISVSDNGNGKLTASLLPVPNHSDIEYQWYRSDSENGNYQPLTDAHQIQTDTGLTGYALLKNDGTLVSCDRYGQNTIGHEYFAGDAFRTTIRHIIIEDGTTSIPEAAFKGCSSVSSLTLPESVSSIGSYAFSDDTALVSIVLDGSDVKALGTDAFAASAMDSGLTTVYVPSLSSVRAYQVDAAWYPYASHIASSTGDSFSESGSDGSVYNAGTLDMEGGNVSIANSTSAKSASDLTGGIQFASGSKMDVNGGTLSVKTDHGSDLTMTVDLYAGIKNAPAISIAGGNFQLSDASVLDNSRHTLTNNIQNSDGATLYQTTTSLVGEDSSSTIDGANKVTVDNGNYNYPIAGSDTINGTVSLWLPAANRVSATLRSSLFEYQGNVLPGKYDNRLSWNGPAMFYLDKGAVSIVNGTATGFDMHGTEFTVSSDKGYEITQTDSSVPTSNSISVSGTSATLLLDGVNVYSSGSALSVDNSTVTVQSVGANASLLDSQTSAGISAIKNSSVFLSNLRASISGTNAIAESSGAKVAFDGGNVTASAVNQCVALADSSSFTMDSGTLDLSSSASASPSFTQDSGTIEVLGGVMKTSTGIGAFKVTDANGAELHQAYAIVGNALGGTLLLGENNAFSSDLKALGYSISGSKTISGRIWVWMPASSVDATIDGVTGYHGVVASTSNNNKLGLPISGELAISNNLSHDNGNAYVYDSLTASATNLPSGIQPVYTWYVGDSPNGRNTILGVGKTLNVKADCYLDYISCVVTDQSGQYDGELSAGTGQIQAALDTATTVDGENVNGEFSSLKPGQTAKLAFSTDILATAGGKYISNTATGDYTPLGPIFAKSDKKMSSNTVVSRVYGPAFVNYSVVGISPDASTVTDWNSHSKMMPTRVFAPYKLLPGLDSSMQGWEFHSWYRDDPDCIPTSKSNDIINIIAPRNNMYGYWTAPSYLTMTSSVIGQRNGIDQSSVGTTTSASSTVQDNVSSESGYHVRANDMVDYTISYTNTNNQPEDGTLTINLPTVEDGDTETALVSLVADDSGKASVSEGSSATIQVDRNAHLARFAGLKTGETAQVTFRVSVTDAGRIYSHDAYGNALNEQSLKVSGRVDYTPEKTNMTHPAWHITTEQVMKVENPIQVQYEYMPTSITAESMSNATFYTSTKTNQMPVPGPYGSPCAMALPKSSRDSYVGDTLYLYGTDGHFGSDASDKRTATAYIPNRNIVYDNFGKAYAASVYFTSKESTAAQTIRFIPKATDNTTVYVLWTEALSESISGN